MLPGNSLIPRAGSGGQRSAAASLATALSRGNADFTVVPIREPELERREPSSPNRALFVLAEVCLLS